MEIQEHIAMVVEIVGSREMTRSEIFAKVSESHDVSIGTVQKWLTAARKKGLLGRTRVEARTQGIEYRFFQTNNGEEPDESDREPFTFQACCPGCGEEKIIESVGNCSELLELHSTLTWSCVGCGDHVRLIDCFFWSALLKIHVTAVAARNPDASVAMPRVTVGQADFIRARIA